MAAGKQHLKGKKIIPIFKKQKRKSACNLCCLQAVRLLKDHFCRPACHLPIRRCGLACQEKPDLVCLFGFHLEGVSGDAFLETASAECEMSHTAALYQLGRVSKRTRGLDCLSSVFPFLPLWPYVETKAV